MSYLHKHISIFVLVLFVCAPVSFAYQEHSYIKLNDQLLAHVLNQPSLQNITFYQLDFAGNVRTEFDAAGNVLDIIDYLPFGVQPTGVSEIAGFVGYQSQGYDFATNLYNSYDARVGRYLQPAPQTFSTLDSQSLNSYSYRSNNPFRTLDPQAISLSLSAPKAQSATQAKSVSGGSQGTQSLNLEITAVALNANALYALASSTISLGRMAYKFAESINKPKAPEKPQVANPEPEHEVLDNMDEILAELELEDDEVGNPITTVDATEAGEQVVQYMRERGLEGRETYQRLLVEFGAAAEQAGFAYFEGIGLDGQPIYGWNLQPGGAYTVTLSNGDIVYAKTTQQWRPPGG